MSTHTTSSAWVQASVNTNLASSEVSLRTLGIPVALARPVTNTRRPSSCQGTPVTDVDPLQIVS